MKRRLNETLGEEIIQIIEVARVVAFELVARTGGVQGVQRVTNVLEAIAKHEIVRALEHLGLPIVLESFVALEHRKEAEVHRAHVHRGDLRLPLFRRTYALLDSHEGRTAGRQIDDHVRGLLDHFEERFERLGALIGSAIRRIARMQVHDCRASVRGAQCGFRDLLRRHRQVG